MKVWRKRRSAVRYKWGREKKVKRGIGKTEVKANKTTYLKGKKELPIVESIHSIGGGIDEVIEDKKRKVWLEKGGVRKREENSKVERGIERKK